MTINYSKQVLLKRGNTAVSSTYVGPVGEVTVDTDLHQIRVHDGERAGGWIVPGGPEYDLLVPLIGNAAAQQDQINSLFANANVQQAFMESIVNQGNVDPGTGNETFWFNTEDGRLYIKQANVWVDSSPAELPNPSYVAGIMEDFAGNIVPAANVTYSLGTQQAQWKDLWVSNNTIYIGNTPITVSNGTLLVDGNAVSGGGNLGKFIFDSDGDSAFLHTTDDAGGLDGYDIVLIPGGEGESSITIPKHTNALAGDPVIISGASENSAVRIDTYGGSWTFGNTGNLALPNGTGILGDTFGDGGLTLRSSEGKYSELGTFDGNAYIWVADAGYDGPSSNSAVYIATGYNTQSQHRWIFNADGSTQFPDDAIKAPDGRFISLSDNAGKNFVTVSDTEVTISAQDTTEYNWTFGQDGNLILPTGGNILNSDNSVYGSGGTPAGNTGEIQVNVDGAFGSYNTLTYVDNGGEMTLGADYVNTGGLFVSDIYSRDILSNVNITSVYGTNWKFGSDGNLTLPGKLWARASDSGSIAFTNDGTTERGYLKVDAGYNMTVNAENNFSVKRNGTDRLAIESTYTTIRSGTATRIETNLVGISRTYTFGETGVLGLPYESYLESTPARNLNLGAWGNISIIADAQSNSTTSWKFGADGNLTIPGNLIGNFISSPAPSISGFGNANFTGNITAGNILLSSGGEIKSAAGVGNVVIEANDGVSRVWKFVSNAALIFPDSTVQTTAYVAANTVSRVTGSWTVTTGSANYSFTVPQNGTYTMWVRGNIPNGIITWNATATVTNNNVPVLGQQFAWNYNALNPMPLEITALPVQFIGTANTIITSNTYGGGPSNTFTFTVNNASGSSQTVYWGYVAQ